MSDIAFRMMMESGVLRPGDRQIRRGPGGAPLHATRQVSDFLNHSVEVLFGPELPPDPPQPASLRFSVKGVLRRLGLLDQTRNSCPELPAPQLEVIRLEAQIQELKLRLKTEQALCLSQREELTKLRAQAERVHVLEADLAIERESSARLVHWLQEAEQELTLREQKSGAIEKGRRSDY